MTDRLNLILSRIPKCKVFADIGCDHGYISKSMLDSGKCERVVFSDVSEKCLEKARILLRKEVEDGLAIAVVGDGFKGVCKVDCALIAGMGGEEIVKILDECKNLPEKLVLQPMKNCDKVRVALMRLGYAIIEDFVFFAEGKYYDLISCEKGVDELTEDEIEFGRTNIIERGADFIARLKLNVESLKKILLNADVKPSVKLEIENKIKRLERYV